MPARQRLHPDFRFLSPKQRFRRRLWLALACLCVVGIGAAMMVPLSPRKSDAALAPADQVSRAEGIPAVSPIANAAVDPQTASAHGAQAIAGKPSCLSQSPDGSCISFQLPKIRMVRVPTPRAASVGKPTTANSKVTEPDKGIVEAKKAQRSAHRQNQRRNQHRGDIRVADWAARGYAHGDYGRQGFPRNFW